MKKVSRWSAFQILQLLIFLAILLHILFRPVDGAGAVQTPEIRLVSCLYWVGFYALILAVEWLPRWIRRRR